MGPGVYSGASMKAGGPAQLSSPPKKVEPSSGGDAASDMMARLAQQKEM